MSDPDPFMSWVMLFLTPLRALQSRYRLGRGGVVEARPRDVMIFRCS
jgi:hypothetical protein